MPELRLEGRALLLDGEAVPLAGGEIHYWRHDPASWDALLDAAKALGLGFVGTYLPWEFHETAPGAWDFRGASGDRRRDLHAFLDGVERRGLKAFVRPGPYIYAEWRNQGVPDDVAALSKDSAAYRERAASWLRAVAAELVPRLATRGGPIVLVQADNESDPAPHLFAEALGFGTGAGPFQAWLAARYGTIDALNAAWGTAHRAFEQARAVLVPEVPGRRRAFLDACAFRYELAADHLRFAAQVLRESGIDVPIVTNTWPGHDAQDWWTFSRIGDLHGIDPYPSNLYRGFEGEHRFHRERFRYLRALGRLPFVAESGAGIWETPGTPVPEFEPAHYRVAAMTALAEGAAGWNWYMLADRDRWRGAPLAHDGAPKPELAPVFAGLAKAYHRLEPWRRGVATSFAATWSPAQRQLAQIAGTHDDEVLRALDALGCAFDFVDVDRDREARPKLMFYAGPSWLSRAGQETLAAYVEGGGTLVFHRALPVLDEALEPLNLLGLPVPDGTGHPAQRRVTLELAGGSVPGTGPAFTYDWPPGDAIRAREQAVDADPSSPLAWSLVGRTEFLSGFRLARGRGEILVLGCGPTRESLLAVLAQAGATPPCLPLTPGIQASLLPGGDRPALVLVNRGDEDLEARVRVPLAGLSGPECRLLDLETTERLDVPCRDGVLAVPLAARSGRACLIEPRP